MKENQVQIVGTIWKFVRDCIIAYISSVTCAAVVFDVFLGISLFDGGFESATSNPVSTKLLHASEMLLAWLVAGWFFAFIFALAPFILGMAFVRWRKKFNRTFFIIGGATTAFFLSPLFALIPNFGFNVQSDIVSYALHKFIMAIPRFFVSGIIAGFVCYTVLKKRTLKARNSSN